MNILLKILKIWFIGFVIIFPIVLSLCKSAKLGDKGNKFINDEEKRLE
jgi:hypothetical protein